jgi:nucleoside-diphosphate-sugar epimerase
MDCIGDRGTEVQEFYRGANVLITGGTGFMGKVLMEKLLRSCPHLSNIYVLIRNKKGKDAETRLEDIFNDPVCTTFFVSKLVFVQLCRWVAARAGFSTSVTGAHVVSLS